MDRFAEWFAFEWAGLGAVILTTVGIYAVVLGFTKLAGLRSFSKLSSFDLVVTVAVGSIVSSVVLLFEIQEAIGRLRLRSSSRGASATCCCC